MMAFTCPACGNTAELPDDYSGPVHCGGCGASQSVTCPSPRRLPPRWLRERPPIAILFARWIIACAAAGVGASIVFVAIGFGLMFLPQTTVRLLAACLAGAAYTIVAMYGFGVKGWPGVLAVLLGFMLLALPSYYHEGSWTLSRALVLWEVLAGAAIASLPFLLDRPAIAWSDPSTVFRVRGEEPASGQKRIIYIEAANAELASERARAEGLEVLGCRRRRPLLQDGLFTGSAALVIILALILLGRSIDRLMWHFR